MSHEHLVSVEALPSDLNSASVLPTLARMESSIEEMKTMLTETRKINDTRMRILNDCKGVLKDVKKASDNSSNECKGEFKDVKKASDNILNECKGVLKDVKKASDKAERAANGSNMATSVAKQNVDASESLLDETKTAINELSARVDAMEDRNAARAMNAVLAPRNRDWVHVPWKNPATRSSPAISPISNRQDFLALTDAELRAHIARHGGTTSNAQTTDSLRDTLLALLGVPVTIFVSEIKVERNVVYR